MTENCIMRLRHDTIKPYTRLRLKNTLVGVSKPTWILWLKYFRTQKTKQFTYEWYLHMNYFAHESQINVPVIVIKVFPLVKKSSALETPVFYKKKTNLILIWFTNLFCTFSLASTKVEFIYSHLLLLVIILST